MAIVLGTDNEQFKALSLELPSVINVVLSLVAASALVCFSLSLPYKFYLTEIFQVVLTTTYVTTWPFALNHNGLQRRTAWESFCCLRILSALMYQ